MNSIDANTTTYIIPQHVSRLVNRIRDIFDINWTSAADIVDRMITKDVVNVNILAYVIKDEDGMVAKDVIRIEVIY